MYYNTWTIYCICGLIQGVKSNNQNKEFSDAHTSVKGSLAHNLKLCRKQSGLSQEELGHRIGADQAYISRIEAGQLNPTIETIAELAFVLKVPIKTLFENDITYQ